MRKQYLFLLLFLFASPVYAGNLTGYWYTESVKVARQDFYPPFPGNSSPVCSTCVISRVWDGTNINQLSGRGMTVGGGLYLLNGGGGGDAANVMVTVSSMTCAGGGSITSVAVSSANVWDTSTRPTQVFFSSYTQMKGISDNPYGHSEVTSVMWPPRFRRAANLWANAVDHDKFYPRGMIPMEEFAISSFTVFQSSSQLVWIDTYISTTILSGNCTGQVSVYEGATVSTTVPYFIKVYNAVLPSSHTFPSTAFIDESRIDERLNNSSVDSAGRDHIHQLMHAHGFSSVMGDTPDANTNRFPSVQYQAYLNGTAYTSAKGYGNARGYATGDNLYMVGTYHKESADPGYSETDSVAFCNYISSWSVNLSTTIYPTLKTVAAYFVDEASSQTLVSTNEKLANWIDTSCVMTGAYVHSWVTNPLPNITTYAPHVTIAVSHGEFGHDPNHNFPNENGFAYTPSTWQTSANIYLTVGTSQTWRYNDEGYNAAYFAVEEEGYVPRQMLWADWLLLCSTSPAAGTCKGGRFAWHSNYWFDENNFSGANTEGINYPDRARTFGTLNSTSTEWGWNGISYSQGDGTLIWPGKDVLRNPNFGFEGAYATWTLKQHRAGVDDADLMTMAYAINPSSTTSIVNNLNTKIEWQVPCTDNTDCSYNNTLDRGFSYDPNAYTVGREALLQIISSATVVAATPSKSMTGGGVFKGSVLIQ